MNLAIIPARIGSKGVPQKNIKLLGKKPLIVYTIEAAKNSKIFDEIHVSTDSKEILDISLKEGLSNRDLRPDNLAGDKTPMLDVIKYEIEKYPNVENIILLQPTSPFRTSDDIKEAYQKFINGNYDSLISVKEIPAHYNPSWAYIEKDNQSISLANGDEQPISRRQDLPNAYHREGSIYIFKKETIIKYNNIYGQNIGFYIIKRDTVNIDTLDDFKKAEKLFLKK